jgi:predicted DNA-binding transcriptional regulator YafY
MPVNKEAYLRYKIINRCLLNKRKPFPTMEDLKAELKKTLGSEFSTSTVQKDIKAMKEDQVLDYNAPIGFDRSRLGYYYTEEGYSIDGLGIDDEELDAMNMAMNFMESLVGTSMGKNYRKALEKIYQKLAIDKKAGKFSHDFIITETKPDNKGLEVFDRLVNHILNKQVIEIVHYSYQRKATNVHRVHPYVLKEFNNQWYLVAFSEQRGEVRTFGLNRIVHIKLIKGEKYKYPEGFDPEEYFRDCLGVNRGYKEKKEKIRLWFSQDLSPYIESDPIHSSQKIVKDSSSFEIELDMFITIDLVSKLMGYGRNARVLSPVWLAEDLQKHHERAIGRPGSAVKKKM